MASLGFSEPLAQWMASNLVPAAAPASKDSLTWTFNVAGAAAMYASYRTTKYWHVLAAPPDGVAVNVLRAAASDRWDDLMIAKLETSLGRAQELRAQVGALCRIAADTLVHSGSLHQMRVVVQGGTGQTVGHVLEGAGHWVHFDNPKELCRLVACSFAAVSGKAGAR